MSSRRFARLLLIALLAWGAGAQAANRFGRVNNGAWNTAATWSTNCATAVTPGVPAANDVVTICPGITVNLNTNSASLNSLVVQGTLNVGSGAGARTLTVNGSLGAGSSLGIAAGGTLQYNTNAAHVINVAGTFSNGGTFTSQNFGNVKTLTVAGLLTNSSVFNFAGSAAMVVNANGGLTNSGAISYTTGQAHQLNVTGTFINGGTLTTGNVGGARVLAVSGLLNNTNTGVFNLAGTTAFTVTAGSVTNAGNMTYATAEDHVVTVAGAFTNSGTFTSANVNNDRTLTVSGLLTNSGIFRFHGSGAMLVNANGGITNSGTFDVNTASNNTHNLVIRGNVVNTGTFNLATGATDLANATFSGTGTMTVSGNGATTRFNRIIIDTGSATINNIVDVMAANFTLIGTGGSGIVYAGNDGTFRLSTPATISPFGTGAFTIPANGRFWLNDAGATVTYPVNNSITLNGGILRIDAGDMTLGNAVNNQLILQSNAATALEMNGGTLGVAGRIASSAAGASGNFTMTGGVITVGTVGNTTNNAIAAPFFLGTATEFTQSGGTIVIERSNAAANASEYDVRSSTSTVTGGTLQIGNGTTPAGQTFVINSVPSLRNLTIQNATTEAQLAGNAVLEGVLTLTDGHLRTDPPPAGGGFILTMGPSSSTSGGSATSHVIGDMVKTYNATGAFIFALGDGTNYRPVTLNCTSLTTAGSIQAKIVAGDHPDTTPRSLSGVNPTRSVNRYYTLANPTLTGLCNVTLTYLAGDLDGGTTPANFVISRGLGGCANAGTARVCSSWTRPPLAGAPSGTQATATGVPVIATDPEVDFVVGEPGLARFSRERQFIYGRENY